MTMTYTQALPKNAEMPDLAEFVTTEEAAHALGFHVRSIYYMVKNQTLEGRKFGRAWLISKKSIEEYRRRTYGMSPNDPRRGRGQN